MRCVSRSWARLDERLRGAQYPLHRRVHAAPARYRRAEAAFPAAHGDRRVARCVFDVGARAGLRRRRDPNPRPTQPRWQLHHQRPEDVGDQRRQFDTGRGAGAHRRGRGQAASQPDRVSRREANGFRRSGAGSGDTRARSTSSATRASTPPSSSSTAIRRAPTTFWAASRGRVSSR